MLKMTRWVERKGSKVTFGNVVGPHTGSPYVYQLECEETAILFEQYANLTEYCKESQVEIPIAITPFIADIFGAIDVTPRLHDATDQKKKTSKSKVTRANQLA